MKENNEIRDVTINEWIWVVFALLSLANIYGDELELSSLQHDYKHNKTSRKIFLTTASIALLIYFYFVINSYNKLVNLKKENKNTSLQEANLYGNILVFVGAFILLCVNKKNKKEITNDII